MKRASLLLILAVAACSDITEPTVEPSRSVDACGPYDDHRLKREGQSGCFVVPQPPLEMCLCDPPRPKRKLIRSLIAPPGLVDVHPPHIPPAPVAH